MTGFEHIVRRLFLAALPLLMAVTSVAQAADGETLAQVRSRGTLRCGVSEGIAGFSAQDPSGRWSGIQFAGVLFYDGQALMVPAKSGVKTAAGLGGSTVCVEKETSSETHLTDYYTTLRSNVKLFVVDSATEAANAFFAGRCNAYTADASHLAAVRLHAPGGAQAYMLLAERISKEPLGPAVRDDDQHWLMLVRWVLYSLIQAEESGVTRENVRERMRDPLVMRALDPGDDIDAAIAWAETMGAEVIMPRHRNPPDGDGGPNHWEIWLRDLDGYKVVLASPDGTADGNWRP